MFQASTPSYYDFATDAYAVAENVDALLILTDWEEFGSLDLRRLRPLMRYPIIVDGRNVYDPAIVAKYGFYYMSVSRPDMLRQRISGLAAQHAIRNVKSGSVGWLSEVLKS